MTYNDVLTRGGEESFALRLRIGKCVGREGINETSTTVMVRWSREADRSLDERRLVAERSSADSAAAKEVDSMDERMLRLPVDLRWRRGADGDSSCAMGERCLPAADARG
jgi:hypothetical protein